MRRKREWPAVGRRVAGFRDPSRTRERKTIVARLGDLARGRVDIIAEKDDEQLSHPQTQLNSFHVV